MAFANNGGSLIAAVNATGLIGFAQGDTISAATFTANNLALQGIGNSCLTSGVLSGGVLTASGLVVTVPHPTTFVAGGTVWNSTSVTTVTVGNNATNYVFACADGEIRVSTSTTPPIGYNTRTSCLLTKSVASAGTAVLDNTVQHKAPSYDPDSRISQMPPVYFDQLGGKVGIGTLPTQVLDIQGDTIRIRLAKTPASSSATGSQGQIAWDANYFYICTSNNVWRRVGIGTW